MRIKIMISIMAVIFLSFAGYAIAQEETAVPGPVEVGNKICPVSKESVETMGGFKYEYQGKIYNLCCAMCVKDFEKDPEKYSRIAEESVASLEEETGAAQPQGGEPAEAVHEHGQE